MRLDGSKRHGCTWCKEEVSPDYEIKPCGNGDLGVRANRVKSSIMLYVDRHKASGCFDINFCPMCGRNLTDKYQENEPLTLDELKDMDCDTVYVMFEDGIIKRSIVDVRENNIELINESGMSANVKWILQDGCKIYRYNPKEVK